MVWARESGTNLRYATRSLWRGRTFAIATVTTVALAIGAGCTVFTLLNAVLLRPLPYPDSDRLVGLWHSFPGIGVSLLPQSTGTYSTYRRTARSFETIGAYSLGAATVAYEEPSFQPERVTVGWMAASTFSLLRVRPVLGRLFVDADQQPGAPRVVVIDADLWRERFHGDPTILGHTVQVDGVNATVVGVVPASFEFPQPHTRVWLPLQAETKGDTLGTFAYDAIGRLRPGVSRVEAQSELQHLLMRTPESYPELRRGVSTASLLARGKAVAEVHWMRDDIIGGADRVLWLVGATVALPVVVALSNVTSLLLVRLEARQRQFAVRFTLGAPASSIWRELCTETVIVLGIGGAIGLGLAVGALELLVHAGSQSLPRLSEVRIDPTLVGSAFLLTALFGLVSAAVAAARVRATDTVYARGSGNRSVTEGRASRHARATFVVLQVALSLVLLTSALALGRSLLRLRAIPPGFDPASTFTFRTSLPPNRTALEVARFYRDAVSAIGRIPGVVSAGVASRLPLERWGPGTSLLWIDRGPANDALPAPYTIGSASAAYFAAMRIPVVAGRRFDDANVERGLNEAIVSRSFVAHNWRDSTGAAGLGQRIRLHADGSWYTIVGVVGDIRDTSLTAPPSAEVYFPEEASPDSTMRWLTFNTMAFVVRTRGPVSNLAASVSAEIRALDPEVPMYELSTMDDMLAAARGRLVFALLLLAVGAIATLTLGLVGLYGVIAYVVSLRSREIGIRIALGLALGKAARMILRQGQMIIAAGTVIGLGLFLGFARLVGSLRFDVSPTDLGSLAIATVTVFVIGGVAAWVPARRAARIDPTVALRMD